MRLTLAVLAGCFFTVTSGATAQRTAKPPLHGRHWMAITGKPLGATAGAMIFRRAATPWTPPAPCSPRSRRCGTCCRGAAKPRRSSTIPGSRRSSASMPSAWRRPARRPRSITSKGMRYPPEFGPLAAVTPGTPGGLMTMLAEYGTLSLKEMLAPAIQLADGYPMEAQTANSDRSDKAWIKHGSTRRRSSSPIRARRARRRKPGRSSVRPICGDAAQAGGGRAAGAQGREEPEGGDLRRVRPVLQGDIAAELVRGAREEGGLFTHAGPGQLEGEDRGAALDHLSRHRRSTSFPSGSRARRCSRRSTSWRMPISRRWATTAPVPAHALPDDEPRLRRPRFLLWRPCLRAGRTGERAAVQGVRQAALRARSTGSGMTRPSSRAIRIPFRAAANPFADLLARWTVTGRPTAPLSGQQDRPVPQPETRSPGTRSRRPSTPAPPRSRPPTRRAGWSRSRRAAGGCRR